MEKAQRIGTENNLVRLYNDLIDTASVMKAMRDSDPKRAVTLSEYKKSKKNA